MRNFAWAQQAPVVVKAYGQHIGGNIVYHQQVTNNGNRTVVDIAFGLDTNQTSSNVPYDKLQGELSFVMPLGMDMFDVATPPASVSSPTGWTAEIIQIEHTVIICNDTPPAIRNQRYNPGKPCVLVSPCRNITMNILWDIFRQDTLTEKNLGITTASGRFDPYDPVHFQLP